MIDESKIRRALIGFCGANQNALLHYLAYSAALENEAAINDGEVAETSTTESLVSFQAEIVQWLDNEPTVFRKLNCANGT